MEIPSILIGLIFLGVSLGFVVQPFRRKQHKDIKTTKSHVKTVERHAAVLLALRELDFDFKTGKVSEEDYTPLRTKLLVETAQVIEEEKNEDEKLEALIQSHRATRGQSTKCEQCGASVAADQRFCAKCGSPVNHELCPHCGKTIKAGDLFCSSCGTRFEVRVEAAAQS